LADPVAPVAHFGRFDPLPANLPRPLALRYHDNQLRVHIRTRRRARLSVRAVAG